MIKKSNIFSINLKANAIIGLQQIGYLKQNKKSTKDKNLSDFISNLILDFVEWKFPIDFKKIKEKSLVAEMKAIDMKRKELDVEIEGVAMKLSTTRKANGVAE